jgi:uncharacterized protein YcgI (DUF1989 family)
MEMAMVEKFIVSAGGGAGLRLKHGEQLRIIDIEGGQTGDLVAFSADGKQRLSSGRTFDYGGKIYVSCRDGSPDSALFVPCIHLQRRRTNHAVGL